MAVTRPAPTRGSPVLVIGAGNEHRSDDAAGLRVARLLREEKLGSVEIVEASGEGSALLALFEGARTVFLVDAVRSGASPGTLHRLEPGSRPLPRDLFPSSTHSFGIAEAVELARALGGLPRSLTILGIEGKSFEPGLGLSPEVEEAARRAAEVLKEEIRKATVGEQRFRNGVAESLKSQFPEEI